MAQDDNATLSQQERQKQDIAALLGKPTSVPKSPQPSTHTVQQPASSPPSTNHANSPSTPAASVADEAAAKPVPAPIRQDQVQQAIKFLSSAKVQAADKSKKVAFLKQKGLTQEEIDEAFQRTSGSPSSSSHVTPSPTPPTSVIPVQQHIGPASPPTIPPRPLVRPPTQIMYYSYEPVRMTWKRILAMAIIAGSGAIGLTAGLVGVVRRYMIPIFRSISGYQSQRYKDHHERYQQVRDTSTGTTQPFTTILEEQKALVARLEKLSKRLQKESDRRDDASLGSVKTAMLDFKDVINRPDLSHSPSYMPYMYGSTAIRGGQDHPAIQGFKSEVRSFKGMLLSRRNFPSAKPTPSPSASSPGALPATSTTSTPSLSSSTTKKPQVFHPRQQQQSYRDELKAAKEEKGKLPAEPNPSPNPSSEEVVQETETAKQETKVIPESTTSTNKTPDAVTPHAPTPTTSDGSSEHLKTTIEEVKEP